MSWANLSFRERKQLIRQQMLALRNSKSIQELDSLSADITRTLLELPEIIGADTVSTYLHIGSEVRTSSIVDWLLSNGRKVIIPITDKTNKRLIFSELRLPERELQRGALGIPEPKPEIRKPVPLEQADVVLVPGVAWDLRGYRIGYGAGYYDRSLNSLKRPVPKIGLSFEFQIVERIPKGRFDRRVDKLVTERRCVDMNLDQLTPR
jgi:5-formyltetrahydrofolate cyclo-ligase